MKLTLPQQDVYFEQLLFPKEPIYNIGAKIEIKGHLDFETLKKAYVELINQHDSYRTIFIREQDAVTSKVIAEHKSELGFVDFSLSNEPMEEACNYMQKEFMKPFDLFAGDLLHRFTLVKVKGDFHYLFSVYHHIITDGWGTSLMFQRFVQNYNELAEFGEVKTTYAFTYEDFVNEDVDYYNSESFIQDKNYWVQKFNWLPENLFEKMDSSIQINKSRRKELIVKRATYNQLNQLATSYKCSTFHLILGVLYAYFGRKHQNNHFAIGLPVLNRSKSKYKKTVGLFMGISPLRIALDFEADFEQLVTEIKNQLRNDYRYQRFPLGKLIQELQLFREKERLFNITLSYEKQNYSNDFLGTKTTVIPLTHQSERVALAIYIREFDESEDVKIDFDYNLNYFDESKITNVVCHFENLINSILIQPENKIKDLVYLSKTEEHQLVHEFNNTKFEYPNDITIIELFKHQVLLRPDKIALTDDRKSYSYTRLNHLSDQIAAYLIYTFGEKDKSPIAVLLNRSADMVATLLGILKTGRAYIPLDPTFPKERLDYILHHSQSNVLIVDNEYQIKNTETVQLKLQDILKGVDRQLEVVLPGISSIDTAYIIYTSGSTGSPKGVEIGHQSLVNFLISIQQAPGVTPADTLFSVTTYSFDISILEFFAPLISGAALYIASQEILSEANLIIQRLAEVRPTIIQATPSFYQLLFNADWNGDKALKILCGGDLLNEGLAEKLIDHSLEVWNMYGPTETTIWSSIKKIEHPKDSSNIGKPINNTQFYILDSFLSPKPIGIIGAIYIAGDGLAKGYYKNEQLTKTKFIKDPFETTNRFIYETGDLGKWNEKGEIEFLGRNDNQVKIRGYRIELGDIESHLSQLEEIEDAVVIAKKETQQEAFLVAYILVNDEETDTAKIIAQLKAKLPYYMVPNVIVPLNEFPLTPNKKVDRKDLTQRAIVQSKNPVYFKAPVSQLEKKISEYWNEVLIVKEPISVTDNFFALGGHSLKAVKLVGLISKQLLLDISVKIIFDYPTIESLSEHLQKLTPDQLKSIPFAESKDVYRLTPAQYSIWLASQKKVNSIAYNMFSVYKLDGTVHLNRITEAIKEIIWKYEILRTSFIEINGVPYQKINAVETISFSIPIHELHGKTAEEAIDELIHQEFNLESDLLIRVHLLQLATDNFLLVFITHHAIMDGLSLEIFTKEFIRNYNENNTGYSSGISRKELQFKDYSEWFNQSIENSNFKNEVFWKNYLQHFQPAYLFDRDFDVKNNNQSGSSYQFEISTDHTLTLKKIAKEEQCTFYTVLISALTVLIYKFSNHADIGIGIVNAGRNNTAIENQIGMFVKSLILRTEIKTEQTFIQLLKQTRENLLAINDHQDISYNEIMPSAIDVMLVYQNSEFSFENINELHNLKLASFPVKNKYSRIPIVFNLFESENGLNGVIEYNSDLFEESTIQIIALKYCKVIDELIRNPSMQINLINIELEVEKSKTMDFEFNF